MESNFIFLRSEWKHLADIGEIAEITLKKDPNTALIKLRQLGEYIAKAILKAEKIPELEALNQVDRIRVLKREDIIDGEMEEIFHLIRKKGNEAVHDSYGESGEAEIILSLALKLSAWFKEVYGSDFAFNSEKVIYKKQNYVDYEAEYKKLVEEVAKREENLLRKGSLAFEQSELDILEKEPARTKEERGSIRKNLRNHLNLSEKETRFLIDSQLSEAGWIVDSELFNYKTKKTFPEKGKFMVIAEWPCKKDDASQGYADYAFFLGKTLVGILEAKKYDVDIPSALRRDSRMYAKGVEVFDGVLLSEKAPYGEYKAPFMFASNGRAYNEQMLEKSGIWFLDGRDEKNLSEPLKGFYSPLDLKGLLEKDERLANQKLKEDSLDYLKSKSGLNLRDYQVDAVKSVEEALLKGQNKILLTMATGTGKTRTALGILYRLLKSGKYNRILFVVDRGSLGEQAMDTFQNAKVEQNQTLSEIYGIKGLTDKKPEEDTRVHIATVQGLVKRILYSSEEKPTVGQYDCIIIDEAHRGYILDKTMSDEEYDFKNELDFQSKYRSVVEYFKADKIALTATPALHTYQIFGNPVYEYSYRQAVIDGYLVDFEPPYQIKTRLSQGGIGYTVGEIVTTYDTDKQEIKSKILEDELNFEVDSFNKTVITEGFNRAICSYLVKNINPDGPEKTLIFTANDAHADLIVRVLREEYEKSGIYEMNNDMIEKITGSIKDSNQMIRKFRNEHYPTIGVTVDLLTTGVDVPKISNLVFLRKVKSRILYEQMIGRATRKCDEIKKEYFKIFDGVDLYRDLEKFTDMKPVVTNPNITFGKLLENLSNIKGNPDSLERFKGEIVAKLRRKNQRMEKSDNELFRIESKRLGTQEFENLEIFIENIKNSHGDSVYNILVDNRELLEYLDISKIGGNIKIIDGREDEIVNVKQKFSREEAEDYLEEFKKYIKENPDGIEAISILKTAPEKFTRKDLKDMELFLANRKTGSQNTGSEKRGYDKTILNTAYKISKNQEIVSDMLTYIKNAIKGSPIIDHNRKIEDVMDKVYSLKRWNTAQKNILERIKKQLEKENIITREDLNSGAFKTQYGNSEKIDKHLDGMLNEIIELIRDEIIIN